MTSGRPYRDGMPVEVAMAELRRCTGTQFDPECVAAFERAMSSGAIPPLDHSVQRQTLL
jgi:HD-GYP domain-containing protein (c-di-GMP phosphodiesterase class II)